MLDLVPLLVVAVCLTHGALLVAHSRRRRLTPLPAPRATAVVFVVPCLNEEEVIERTLERLLALPGDPYVLVVDDASTDRTGELVRRYLGDRVDLLQRSLPDARQGKGAALNAALAHLSTSPLLLGHAAPDVLVCVVDADGRLDQNVLGEVVHVFRDPAVGAVQIGVRMTNTDRNVLTRMQDMEFVVFTEVFQRARTRFGTAGMGGNGQFVRLSALRSLGPDPWSDCLTEDLDLGLRLVERGWRTMFVATTAVHQQAVDDLKRLMRQRTRWFQGHLQCWPHLWRLVRSKAPAGPAVDLSLHLLASMAMIGMGMVTASLVLGVVAVAMQSPAEAWAALTAGGPGRILLAYLCTFGLCWVYGFVYWLRTPSVRFHTALLLAHAYLLYGFMWVVVGVRAVVRQALGRRGWAKTARSADAAAPPVPSR